MQNEKTKGRWPTDTDLAKRVGALLMRYLVDDDRAAPQFKHRRYDKKRDRTYEPSWNPHYYEDKKAKLRPFTPALLERHFYANAPDRLLGAYAIDAEGYCRSGAIDIDGSSHAGDDDLEATSADARASDQLDAVLEVLRAAGARPLVATSKSGTGYHVRLLFDGRIRAEDARSLMLAVARVAGLPPATEVYPKQDSKGEGWGNLLALPGSHWYDADARSRGRSCASWLIDAESWRPVPFAEWPALIERGCDHLGYERIEAVAHALYALGEERQGRSPYDEPAAARAPAPSSNRSPGEGYLSDFAWTPMRMEEFLGDSGAKFEKRAGGSGQWEHRWVLEACPFAADHSGDDASGSAVFMDASGKLGFKCHHAHCANRTWKDARAKINPAWKSDPYAGAEYRPIPLIKKVVKKFSAVAAATVAAVCLSSGTVSAIAHGAPPAAPSAAMARPEAPAAPEPKFLIPQGLLEDEPRWDVIGLDGEVERPDVDDLAAADILASDGPPAEDEPCLWPMGQSRPSLFPAESRAMGWTGVPLGRKAPPPRMREPGEDEWEVGGEQRRAERIKKLAAEKLAKKKRPRWSWKTKEYARDRMQEEKDQVWHGFRDDMEYSSEADRAKTVKFAVRGLRSFMKALSCAEFAHALLGNRGTNKVRPCFCENGKLCFFCAEDEAKYKGMYALEHWAPGRYTWIAHTHYGDPSSYEHGIKDNREDTSKAVDKVCGKKTPRRYYEGWRTTGMVIPGEEAYDAIRAAALPNCPLPEGAPREKFSWDMTYCKVGVVESLTREEVVERVYGPTGIWMEPSTKFFRDGMVVCRLLSDSLMDDDERRVKLDAAWLKMRDNCYVYTHKAKRTAARKGGKEAMPIVPDSEYPAWRRLKVLEQKMRDDPDYVPSDEEFKIVGLLFRGKTIAAVPDSVEAPWERAGIVKSVHESVLDNLGKPDYTPEKLAERFERGRRAAAEPQQAPQPRGSRRSGIVKLMGTVETIAYEAAARGSAAFSFAPAG